MSSAARTIAELHDLAVLIDQNGVATWLSEGFSRLSDPDAASIGARLDAFVASAEPGLVSRVLGREPVSGEAVRLRAPGGHDVAARLSSSRASTSECAGGEALAILRLEEGQPAADSFRRQLDVLAPILEGASGGVLVVDRARFVRWANTALARMTGLAPSELIGQPLAFLLRTPAAMECALRVLGASREPTEVEIELQRRDGNPLVTSVTARPIALPETGELGSVVYLRDVTEQRHTEQGLRRRAEEMQNWVHAVSHDLRSPLVAVLGFARLLSEDYGDRLDEQGLRFLRRIEEAGRTMEALVHDLLELARIGRSEPKRTLVDPRDVLLQLQAELKPRLEAARLDLILPVDPPLIWCDRTQLYQVLCNLVSNALDHAGPSRHPTIEVGVTAEAIGVHLTVQDFGRGIEPADRERIFEIFQTCAAARSGRRGTGIGLAIVRKIAESHGGAAWVESQPGTGAIFHVTFPNA